jgi:hypothetical protein
MSAYDLACVKTQKIDKRRELFFSDQAKANTLANSCSYNCVSEKTFILSPSRDVTFLHSQDPKRTLAGQDRCRAKMTPKAHFASRKSLL